MIKDRKRYEMSKISHIQTEITVLETFTAIQRIPIPEEICMEWLLPYMKIEEARIFLQSLKDKGALQFDENQAEYTIQSAWMQPVCSQDRLKENYNRLVELSGDSEYDRAEELWQKSLKIICRTVCRYGRGRQSNHTVGKIFLKGLDKMSYFLFDAFNAI